MFYGTTVATNHCCLTFYSGKPQNSGMLVNIIISILESQSRAGISVANRAVLC